MKISYIKIGDYLIPVLTVPEKKYNMEKISEKRFEALSAEYEQEQQDLEEIIKEQEKELTEFNEDTDKVEQFIELAEKYTDFTELTTPMINEFVDKIVVHAPDKSSGERVQEVEIYLKYIGKFDVPIPEPTAEELAQQEKARIRRQKNRKAVDKYQKRIKAERLAHKQELEKQKENVSA